MQEALMPELERRCGYSECEAQLSALDGVHALAKYCSDRCRGRAHRASKRQRASQLTSKFCGGCQQDKPIDQYSKPWVHYCRSCARAKSRERYIAKGGTEFAYAKSLKYNYGLTVEEYQAKLATQGGRCAVCNEEPDRRLHVDHNHSTGAVRDLLCEWCNHAIGKAKDNPARLRAMADYLERHAQEVAEPLDGEAVA
jgi:hypothetical protein